MDTDWGLLAAWWGLGWACGALTWYWVLKKFPERKYRRVHYKDIEADSRAIYCGPTISGPISCPPDDVITDFKPVTKRVHEIGYMDEGSLRAVVDSIRRAIANARFKITMKG